MKTKYKQQINELKQIITTKEGLFLWVIANVITSLHWVIPFSLGVLLKNNYFITLSASLFAIGMSPFVPLWLFNIIITIFLWKKLFKKSL
jgi:hypothetical protein